MDMTGTSAMGMPWRVRRCLFSLGQGIASDVGGGSLQPPCSRSLVDGTPKTGVWSPLLCVKTGATEHINRGHARSEIEFQSNRSIANTSQIKIVIVTCCCYQMDLPARSVPSRTGKIEQTAIFRSLSVPKSGCGCVLRCEIKPALGL